MDYLTGDCTLEDAIDKIKKETRHFAKRQLTWFRREKEVTWVEKSNFQDTEGLLKYLLADFNTYIGSRLI